MAEAKDAERFTGYQVGGISPFGARRALPVYAERGGSRTSRSRSTAGRAG